MLTVVLVVIAVGVVVGIVVYLNVEMKARDRTVGRRVVVIGLLLLVFPVGFFVWMYDRDNHPGTPLAPTHAPEPASAEPPRFRDTLLFTRSVRQHLGQRQQAIALGLPIVAPAHIRGNAPGLPRRWRAGHLRISGEALRWWRHLSRRRTSIDIDPGRVRVRAWRAVRSVETLLLSPQNTVVSCEFLDGGDLELAFRFDADLNAFLAAVGAPTPAGQRGIAQPWWIAGFQGLVAGAVVGGLGVVFNDTESIVLAIPAGLAVIILQGRALSRRRAPATG